MGYSQLGQDDWVLQHTNGTGFFVEFGAGDGTLNSNTKLLQELDWCGILAEPCKTSFKELAATRMSTRVAVCDFAIGATEGIAKFRETPISELSTIAGYGIDHLSAARESYVEYDVIQYPLQKLLDFFKAPEVIDYLSIDTEGSEFDILSSFDFSSYNIRLITVEHNYTPAREQILELLTSKGYIRDREVEYDDWYIKR